MQIKSNTFVDGRDQCCENYKNNMLYIMHAFKTNEHVLLSQNVIEMCFEDGVFFRILLQGSSLNTRKSVNSSLTHKGKGKSKCWILTKKYNREKATKQRNIKKSLLHTKRLVQVSWQNKWGNKMESVSISLSIN